jgi:two-component system sensor histidine kinase KdpD
LAGDALKLAETLGADSKTVVGSDIVEEVLRLSRFENVTQIVVGGSPSSRIAALMGRSLPHELVKRADGIGVHFVTGTADRPPRRERSSGTPLTIDPTAFVWSTAVVAITLALGFGLSTLTVLPNLSLIFLLAVFTCAVGFGVWPAVYASGLSFLAMNFFFVEPLYTFSIAEPHELLSLIIFLVVSISSAALAGRVREQVRLSAQRVRALRRLYEFTRKLSSQANADGVADAAAAELHATLARPATVLIDDGNGELVLHASWPPVDDLDAGAMTAGRWAFTHGEAAGHDTTTLPTVPWRFLPLSAQRGRVGAIGVGCPQNASTLDQESLAQLDAIAEQTAAALERVSLTRETVSARSAVETERVRNTLLASVSHDFRTPLASILGSATSLIDYADKLDAGAQRDLLFQIKQEAEDLDDMVRNLLAVTRIDAGALELRWDWVDVAEVLNRVAASARRRYSPAPNLLVDLPDDLPLIRADPGLLEQSVMNVVANAIEHTPQGTSIELTAQATQTKLHIVVTDNGPGIPADLLPRLFDRFSRSPTSKTQGVGLGLAIAKGIVEAHQGSIAASSPVRARAGTRIELTLLRQGLPP